MNASLFITLFVFHHVADLVFQTYWEYINKEKKIFPLLVHSLFYAIILSLSVYFLELTKTRNILPIFVILFASHFILDSHRFVRWFVKRVKGLTPEKEEFKNMVFFTDQSFHYFVIFIASLIF